MGIEMEKRKISKELEIRNVTAADIPQLLKICLETGDNGKDASLEFNDPYILGQYYAAPYPLFAAETSFVVIDKETELPAGYIIGCSDTLIFNEQRREYLKPLKKYVIENANNKSDLEKSIKNTIAHELEHRQFMTDHNSDDEEYWSIDYPAHLHIDLLPSLQGYGMGHALMQTFLENLRKLGVKGVHLGVGGENKRACAFYEREGFSVLKKTDWGFWLGMKL